MSDVTLNFVTSNTSARVWRAVASAPPRPQGPEHRDFHPHRFHTGAWPRPGVAVQGSLAQQDQVNVLVLIPSISHTTIWWFAFILKKRVWFRVKFTSSKKTPKTSHRCVFPPSTTWRQTFGLVCRFTATRFDTVGWLRFSLYYHYHNNY